MTFWNYNWRKKAFFSNSGLHTIHNTYVDMENKESKAPTIMDKYIELSTSQFNPTLSLMVNPPYTIRLTTKFCFQYMWKNEVLLGVVFCFPCAEDRFCVLHDGGSARPRKAHQVRHLLHSFGVLLPRSRSSSSWNGSRPDCNQGERRFFCEPTNSHYCRFLRFVTFL